MSRRKVGFAHQLWSVSIFFPICFASCACSYFYIFKTTRRGSVANLGFRKIAWTQAQLDGIMWRKCPSTPASKVGVLLHVEKVLKYPSQQGKIPSVVVVVGSGKGPKARFSIHYAWTLTLSCIHFFAFFLGNQTLWKLLQRKLSMMTSCNPDINCSVCVDKNFLRLQNRVWRPIWGPDGPGGQECRRLGAQWKGWQFAICGWTRRMVVVEQCCWMGEQWKGSQWIVNFCGCGWMVVVEQECCWVGLQFTIFLWTEDLCVQLEQHESQSKKSDYQGGQLAQANTNTKKIRKACLGTLSF